MLKRAFALLMVLAMTLFALPACAQALGGTYYLSTPGLTVTVPGTLIAFTRSSPDSDFDAYGLDAQEVKNYMRSWQIYLSAYEVDLGYVVEISCFESDATRTLENLALYDSAYLARYSRTLAENNGYTTGASYQHSQAIFLTFTDQTTLSDGTTAYCLEYATVYNGKKVSIDLTTYDEPVSETQRTVLQSVVDGIVFDAADTVAPAVPAPSATVAPPAATPADPAPTAAPTPVPSDSKPAAAPASSAGLSDGQSPSAAPAEKRTVPPATTPAVSAAPSPSAAIFASPKPESSAAAVLPETQTPARSQSPAPSESSQPAAPPELSQPPTPFGPDGMHGAGNWHTALKVGAAALVYVLLAALFRLIRRRSMPAQAALIACALYALCAFGLSLFTPDTLPLGLMILALAPVNFLLLNRRAKQPRVLYCAHCGAPFRAGDQFCTRCGEKRPQ